MTGTARPDLSGLFTGSTPPDRSSGIAGALPPRVRPAPPVVEHGHGHGTPPARSATAPTVDPPHTPEPGPEQRRTAPQWLDPVTAVERYFRLLQTVLDINRDLAITCATAVRSLPRRARTRR